MKLFRRAFALLLLSSMALTPLAACKSPTPITPTAANTTAPPIEISPSANNCNHTPSTGKTYCTSCKTILKTDSNAYQKMIYFTCDDEMLTEAYKIAIADCVMNTKLFQGGLLPSKKPVIIAGADYDTPLERIRSAQS